MEERIRNHFSIPEYARRDRKCCSESLIIYVDRVYTGTPINHTWYFSEYRFVCVEKGRLFHPYAFLRFYDYRREADGSLTEVSDDVKLCFYSGFFGFKKANTYAGLILNSIVQAKMAYPRFKE